MLRAFMLLEHLVYFASTVRCGELSYPPNVYDWIVRREQWGTSPLNRSWWTRTTMSYILSRFSWLQSELDCWIALCRPKSTTFTLLTIFHSSHQLFPPQKIAGQHSAQLCQIPFRNLQTVLPCTLHQLGQSENVKYLGKYIHSENCVTVEILGTNRKHCNRYHHVLANVIPCCQNFLDDFLLHLS